MKRALEAVFRHPFQLLILIVLLPVIGVGAAYLLVPRTYSSSASLWALHRYEVIGATGPESDLTSTPAQTQATALQDLLQTRSFALDVLRGIDIEPTLHLSQSVLNDPQQLEDALFSEISKNVTVVAQGYNLFSLNYHNRDPRIAQQVVLAVIRNYGLQSLSLSVAEGKDILTTYQTELQNAQQQESAAVAAEAQYVSAHPDLSPTKLSSDPQYQSLDAQRIQAQQNVQTVQTNINTIQQTIGSQGSNSNALYQVIDSPQVATQADSRSKGELTGGGIGLGLALLADMIYLIIVVRRDRAVYSANDLLGVVDIPVVMQLPKLLPASVTVLTNRGGNDRGAVLLDRPSNANGHAVR